MYCFYFLFGSYIYTSVGNISYFWGRQKHRKYSKRRKVCTKQHVWGICSIFSPYISYSSIILRITCKIQLFKVFCLIL